MPLSYKEMERVLMDELRLYHHPIAVTYLATDEDVEKFAAATPHVTPVKPLTFCQCWPVWTSWAAPTPR